MSPLQMSALIPGPEIVPETTDAGEGTEDAVATHAGLEPVALPPQPIAAAPISEIRDGTLAREMGTVGSIRRFHGVIPIGGGVLGPTCLPSAAAPDGCRSARSASNRALQRTALARRR